MPPPFPYRTVVGTYTSPDGAAVAGDLRFIPSTAVYDAAGNVVVPALPITVALDAYGQFDVDLLVTDDPDVNPSGWTWRLTELFSPQREWEFQIPSTAPSTVNIADLTPVVTTDVTWAYATLATVQSLNARVTDAEATVADAESAAASSASAAAGSAGDSADSASDAAATLVLATAVYSDLTIQTLMGAL